MVVNNLGGGDLADSAAKPLKSGIFYGWVRHRRFSPRRHSFKYAVFMMYLDIDEIDRVLANSRCWGRGALVLARFKRSDYFGNADIPLDQAVRARVAQTLDVDISGPVRILTNLRYFGFIINPLTVYYCFDCNEQLQAMLLEVTNTPWGERHQYIVSCDPTRKSQRITFDKALHVSPFHPMDIYYRWQSNTPGGAIAIHMQNRQLCGGEDKCIFDAMLKLKREDISRRTLALIILRYPLMTIKVMGGIYWQAIRLLVKRIPFYSYPKG